MSLHRITDIDELHRHLHAALQLEHATIPPYLTALYSIRPGTNTEAYHIIRAVVVEEMLHLTLAANILNAVGGNPDLTYRGFVPEYPAFLPDGETDFQVGLQRFSRDAIETFLRIERPAEAAGEGVRTVRRAKSAGALRAARVHDDSEEHFYSIGEFYQAIEQALVGFHKKQGAALFSGDPARQVTPAYYYSGGGEIIAVTDLGSAKAAIRLISEQGEGLGGGIFDYEDEISHYYRFEQLVLGRYYQEGDEAGKPSGLPVDVEWDAVFPIKPDARLADYPEGSELHAGAVAFNRYYAEFLSLLTRAFQGEPGLLIEAVGGMFRIKEMSYQLMRQPIDGTGGLHAAPTFEIPAPKER
ncbi:MAG TPA: ferritin-like protein [Thermoanaerobaculia bacterium]|nr:ferritin-like protein [Thermoanaerobaculia bacterium]